MNPIRVMLVDDHSVLRSGLKMLLNAQSDMQVVAEASSASAVLPQAERALPDVVVLDLTLPGGGGLAQIGPLTSMPNPPRVLILTMHDEPAYARSAIAAGATGYIVKTIAEQDLLAAIRGVARGRVFIDLDNKQRTDAVFHAAGMGGPASATPVAPKLSEREEQVLKLLGQGFTNQQIAEHLDLSAKTVATYRARIGEKLGLHSTAEFVQFAQHLRSGPGGD